MKRLTIWLGLTIGCALILFGIRIQGRAVHAQSTTTCAADVVVQSGDTLSAIAARQADNSLSYQAIVAATNAKAAEDSSYATIANPALLSVGWKLCIPAGSGVALLVATPQSTATPTNGPSPTPTNTPIPLVTP
ncbi:MAG: LysM peptidoglycan-binding domain-containing protein, partial [Caldilineaceae bacterium]|nr:LysM peptidoglycan-binding domain-containing protein [Caldilineaceae bacterium]